MPRNVKESDEEVEPKTGRRTRAALNPSVLDSPLRRSSRIKQPSHLDGSSPDSPSDSSSVAPTRGSRRRTATGEPGITEPSKGSRTRHNSIASDISEFTETESLPDGPPKRVTRRSAAGLPAAETPTKLNGRTRRTTRAGSESKTSPPAGRTTRRTRATSLEPEGSEDHQSRGSETPVKSRKRASVLPSEPAVAEESEDNSPVDRRPVDPIVFDIVEEEADVSSNKTLNSSRRRSKTNANKSVERMEIDDNPVEESEGNTIDKTTRENIKTLDDVPKKFEDSTKTANFPEANESKDQAVDSASISCTASSPARNLSVPSDDKQEKSPGNKENEILNDGILLASASVKLSNIDIRNSNRKSMNSLYTKPTEKRHNASLDERFLSNTCETPKKTQENVSAIATTNSTGKLKRNERYSVDECVVVIEPMRIDQNDKLIAKETPEVAKKPLLEKNSEIAEVKNEATEDEPTKPQSTSEDLENVVKIEIDEDIAIGENVSKLSDVVDVIVNEEDVTTKEKPEISEISGTTEEFNLQMTDTSDAIVDKTLDEDENNEKSSSKSSPKPSPSKENPATSMIDDKTACDVANDDETPSDKSNTIISTVDSRSSINTEKSLNSDVNEENMLLAKDVKSSIVTESSTSGSKADVEISSTREMESRRKSLSIRRNSRVDDGNNEKNRSNVDSTAKEDVEKKKFSLSDDESDCEGYPAFVDIAADEWKSGDNGKSGKNEEIETNSVHSASTERMESECDLELIDKDVGQDSEKDDQRNLDYDSDDTVKIAVAGKKSVDRNNDEKNLSENSETRMEISSDDEEEEEEELDVVNVSMNDISKKRESLNKSRKNDQTNSPAVNKSILIIADSSVKSSPLGMNTSRNVDSAKTSGSVKNTPSKKEKRANETPAKLDRSGKTKEIEDDDEEELNESALLMAIDKKLKGRLSKGDARDSLSSRNNSPANSKIDKERLNRSGKIGSARNSLNDKNESKIVETDDDPDGDAEMEKTQEDPSGAEISLNKSRKSVSPDKSKNRRSKLAITPNSDSENESVSPEAENEVLEKSVKIGSAKKSANERLSRSGKIDSARKSLSDKNSSKTLETDDDPDCDAGMEKSQEDPSGAEISMNKSRKSSSPDKSKNRRSKLVITPNSDSENDSVSLEAQNEVLEKSVKIGSAKKSANERLNRSGKIDSARKSLNEKNSSKIFETTDSDGDMAESQEDPLIAEISLNKSEKSASPDKSKNRRSKLAITPKSNPETDLASPKTKNEALEKSVKIGSLEKSAKRTDTTIPLESSDSEIEATQNSSTTRKADKDEILEKSVKIGSAKKSSNKTDTTVSLESSDSEIEATQYEPTTPDHENANQLAKSVKFGSADKSGNKNISYIAKYASSDSDASNDNSQDKLDNLAKIGSAKKSAKKLAMMSMSSSDSSDNDDDDSPKNREKSLESLSPKKSLNDKNYSTIAQVNSDSEVEDDVQSDDSDDADVSRKIPRFLFDRNGNDGSSNSDDDDDDDSSQSIDSDIARELNLDGKSILEYSDDDVPADDCMATESESSDEDDDGADLADFVVEDDDDDEDEDSEVISEMDVEMADDENNVSSTVEKKKLRKRIIPRPARASDVEESDEIEAIVEPNVSSTRDKPTTVKTPPKTASANEIPDNLFELEPQSVDLNSSVKKMAARNKNLSIQSSTPKTLARHSLLVEKLNSAKTNTPANSSMKSVKSSAMFETSMTKKLSKSVCEKIETPTKLESSLKTAKTPKASQSVKQLLQTSLPTDLNNSSTKSNLSKIKSTKISTLNQTVVPAGSESPETRFLMKEKLNDSMPALKLQQKAAALRRSVLDNIREKFDAMEEDPAEDEGIDEKSVSKRVSLGKDGAAASDAEISIEKKKKKKKKKKNNPDNSNASVNPEETATSFTENIDESNAAETSLPTSGKKAKKLSKKNKMAAETPVPEEETRVISKTKKRKMKQDQIIENDEPAEPEMKNEKKKKKEKKKLEEEIETIELPETDNKDKKKKKKKESTASTEPEVPVLRPKSRRIAAALKHPTSDSDDAPEAVDFTKARDAALRDLRKVAEIARANQEATKKKNNELEASRHERKTKESRITNARENFEKTKTSVKRLPDDVLESLTDVAERPKKRRKVSKDENFVPSTTMFAQSVNKPKNLNVDDGYIPLSTVGGTTQFSVINLKKAAKQSKKSVAAVNFREKMLARNPRQPVSAYLIYQQKQKASGQGRPF